MCIRDSPRPMINSPDLNFSFSGLKTAVLYEVKRLKTEKKFDKQTKYDISLAFQDAAIDCLVKKSIKAMRREDCNQLVLSGGVAANKALRKKFKEEIDEKNIFYPDLSRCTDNGAMIAFAASEKLNFDIWLDKKTSVIVKVTYKRMGNWEYRLKNLE